MKNIHVLPTNKPSRLCLDSKDKLWFAKNSGYTIADGKVNIYITSDEEIKEDDYRMNIQRGYFKKSDKEGLDYYNKRNDVFKKIILTTDQDLIKDGVQAIDDEFLEWFVKNPSCEEVEVEEESNTVEISNMLYTEFNYNIIIPKEEPKQETLEEAAFESSVDYKPFEDDLKPQKYYEYGFIKGAKWQQERSYSEENSNHLEWIYNRLIGFHNENPNYDYMIKLKTIIDQFKKK